MKVIFLEKISKDLDKIFDTGNIKLTNTDGEAVTSGEGQTVTLLCIDDDPETYLTTGDSAWNEF